MNNSSWKEELQSLAASQWGLFTAAQARELGIQRNQVARLAKRGLVESVDYGVYRFSSGYEASHTDLKAAWLSLYPKKTAYERMTEQPLDAVVRGRTAAFLHDLGDFYPTPFSFAVSKRRQTRRDNIHCLLEEVDPQDIVFVDSLPVTSVEKTIADLIREGEDPTLLGQVAKDAVRSRHEFNVERLAHLLESLLTESNNADDFARTLLRGSAFEAQRENFLEALSFLDWMKGKEGLGEDALELYLTGKSLLDAADRSRNIILPRYSKNRMEELDERAVDDK